MNTSTETEPSDLSSCQLRNYLFFDPHIGVVGPGTRLPRKVARAMKSVVGTVRTVPEVAHLIRTAANLTLGGNDAKGEVRVVPPTERDLFGHKIEYGAIQLFLGKMKDGFPDHGSCWRVIKYRDLSTEVQTSEATSVEQGVVA